MTSDHDTGADRASHATKLLRDLTRSWTCDGCGRVMKKGARVVVYVRAGQPRNRVFHPDCDPTPNA